MNCQFLRWFLILPFVILFAACGSKKLEQAKAEPKESSESSVEQPIEIVVKKSNTSSDIAPVEAIPADTPAAIPPGAGPIASVGGPMAAAGGLVGPIPVPPIPVGVVVDERCEDIFCGDGKKQDGEECDDGNDDEEDNCDNFCRKIRCGNGRVEGTEECDAKDHAFCTDDCTLTLCGNGEVDEGETCDPPSEETDCNPSCLTSVCGNGVVEFGEECDDDNTNENDGCNNDCQLACSAS